MKKVRGVLLFVFLFTLGLAPLTPCYSLQEWEKKETHSVQGEIRSVDWVAGYIVVRWFNGTRFDEITIKVPDHFVINKNNNDIHLSDLNQGDKVTLKYYDDYFSDLFAVTIDVAGL